MENIKQLQKLAEVFDTDKIITSDEIEQVLKGILVIMNSFKKDNQTLNKETKEVVEILLDRVLTENAKLKETVNRETSDQKEDFAKQVKELKDLVSKVQTIKPIDGVDGKDADEEKIVEDVLAKIKLPEYEVYTLEEKGEDIVAEINALPLEDEYKIDASHIKNLPESKGGTFNGGGWRNLYQLHDVELSSPTDNQVLTYDSTSNTWKNENSAGGGGAWGTITGTLSDQTDLQTALDSKVDENVAITGATKTKITYDAKGLVTAGADATTADIADSSNKRYVTDAQLTVIGNTSGTNTGDQDLSSYLTSATAASTYQPLDTQLTSLAGLSYTGNSLKVVRVNAGETAFELATVSGGVSFGTDNQIPFVNAGGTDFDYVSTFVYDSGKLGIGTASPIGTLHTVLASASPATTAWTSNQAVFGSASSTGAALGITVGSSVVTLQALAPNTAWQDLTFMGAAGYWYGGGNNIGIHVTSGGNIGIRQATASEALDVLGRGLFSQGVTINEGGTDSDTRIESDTHTDAFFLDGANGEITLGAYGAGTFVDTPAYALGVLATGEIVEFAVGGGSGANTALSNLASVAINTTLISDTDNTDDLGTTAIRWRTIYGVNLGATATRFTTGWFTDLTVTNAIAGSITGNAATATALATPRTIGTITGDATSAGSAFDGSANNSNALTLATVNANVGSFGSSTATTTFTVNAKGLITAAGSTTITPAVGSITGLGTGVATALAINVGSAGAFVTFNGALGTPSSGTVTNLTGTASININGTVGATTPTTATFTTATINTSLLPDANDGAVLGAAGTAWSDLFLAEGGVINWDSSDVTITQTGNVLAVAGGDFRIATADVGTNADSVPTISSTNTLTNKTLTAPTINAATLSGDIVLAEGGNVELDSVLSADGTYTGITIDGTAGATLAFGDLIYLAAADSRWELVDADAVGTSGTVLIGLCVLAAASDGSATKILLQGTVRADTAFPALTISAPVYAGETAGDVQTTIPTGADAVIRVVGFALTADSMYFNPSSDHQTVVA